MNTLVDRTAISSTMQSTMERKTFLPYARGLTGYVGVERRTSLSAQTDRAMGEAQILSVSG